MLPGMHGLNCWNKTLRRYHLGAPSHARAYMHAPTCAHERYQRLFTMLTSARSSLNRLPAVYCHRSGLPRCVCMRDCTSCVRPWVDVNVNSLLATCSLGDMYVLQYYVVSATCTRCYMEKGESNGGQAMTHNMAQSKATTNQP